MWQGVGKGPGGIEGVSLPCWSLSMGMLTLTPGLHKAAPASSDLDPDLDPCTQPLTLTASQDGHSHHFLGEWGRWGLQGVDGPASSSL